MYHVTSSVGFYANFMGFEVFARHEFRQAWISASEIGRGTTFSDQNFTIAPFSSYFGCLLYLNCAVASIYGGLKLYTGLPFWCTLVIFASLEKSLILRKSQKFDAKFAYYRFYQL